MQQDKVSKLTDSEQHGPDKDATSHKNVKPEYKPSNGERWNKARPTKMIVFWILLAGVILTIMVGFNFGGWVTNKTAQTMANDAVVQRLALVCVSQYNQDLQKDQKLIALQEVSPYQRDDYVKEQGWATMPGEKNPDNKVADTCAKLLVQIDQ